MEVAHGDHTAPRFEKIIAFRETADGKPEYLVKKWRTRYSESVWMTADALASANATNLIDSYQTIEPKVSEAPFYNPNFDIVDMIVAEVDGGFLVKWKDLGFDQLSLEKNVDPKDLENYHQRKAAVFRGSDDRNFSFQSLHFDHFEFNGKSLTDVELVFLNLVLRSCGHESELRVKDDWQMNLLSGCVAVFHALYSSGNPGPFAIVCSEGDIEKWYEILHDVLPLTTIVWAGSQENRAELEKIMFNDSKYWKFHVILTTPEFLEKDSILEKLCVSVCVLHNVEPELKFAHGLKVVLVTDSAIDSAGALRELTAMLIGKEGRTVVTPDIVQKAAIVKMKLHSKLGKMEPEPVSPAKIGEFWIDCPLTRVQRLLIRKITAEADLDEGFLPLCHKMYRIISHPFLLHGIERKLNGLNYIAVSTKLQVFVCLLKSFAEEGRHVIVISDFGRLLDLIEDIAISKGYSFARIGRTEPNAIERSPLVLYDPSYCPITTELEFIYTAVVLNGEAHNFREMMRLPRQKVQISDIFTLTCSECDEGTLGDLCATFSQGEDAHCETLCKICAMASCIDKEVPSPETLVKRTVDDAKRYKGHSGRVNDIEQFWRILRDSPPPKFPEGKTNFREGEGWTARERDELIRALFSIGWNRWEHLYESTGIMHTIDEVIRASRAVLRTMVKMTSQSVAFARDLIRGESTIYDDEESDRKFMERGHFANIDFRQKLKDETPNLLRRMELLRYLANAVEDAGEKPELIKLARALGSSPSEWWTEENDRMLVLGTYRYGYGRYDHFCEDSEKAIRRVVVGLEQRKLDERILRLAEVIKRSFSFQAEATTSAKGDLDLLDSDAEELEEMDLPNQKLNAHDRRKVIQYICKMGLDTYENIRANTRVRGSVEDVRSYVDGLLAKANDPSSGLRGATASRIRSRVATMKALRQVMTSLKPEDWESIPKWRQMPDYWTPQIEHLFFQKILERGLGSCEEIIALPEFEAVARLGLPPFVSKDVSVAKRIQTLHEFAKKPHPPTSDRKKASASRPRAKLQKPEDVNVPEETKPQAPPSQKVETPQVIVEGKVPTIEELSRGNVEYPVHVTATSQILSIGTIVTDRPGFHSQRYIYPAGFKSCRLYTAPSDRNKRIVWISEIIDDGKPTPLFRISCTDKDTPVVFEGRTPTAPWALALKDISTRFKGKGKSVSGPEAYLLASNVTSFLIQQLPGVDQCHMYEKKDFHALPSPRTTHRKAKKPAARASSSESEDSSTSTDENSDK